jgi:hypothetical protein
MAIEVNATSVLHHTNGSYEFKKTLANVKITKGVWYDFIWQINWDYRKPANGGTGFIKLWVQVDGKGYDQIVDYTGQTGYNNPTSSFLKYGMYPHGWRNHAATKGCETKLCFFDEVKVGDANCDFNDFAVGQATPAAENPRIRSALWETGHMAATPTLVLPGDTRSALLMTPDGRSVGLRKGTVPGRFVVEKRLHAGVYLVSVQTGRERKSYRVVLPR